MNKESQSVSKAKYDEKFKGQSISDKTKWENAYRMAIDTRKFEIEMYWKRATYFWAFIAVTFAGYGLIQRAEEPDQNLAFILACFGFVLSFAWFYANKGSKQWQENWEHHVDQLEDKVTGPLYKTVLKRGNEKKWAKKIETFFVGPSRHSVSKINQLISLYMTLIWVGLILHSKGGWRLSEWSWDWLTGFILVSTVTAIIGVVMCARTFKGDHKHVMDERVSEIID
ncbi:MAG: hypothetical protein CMP47_13045 [Rickettsiales bacterium]|nr:hypothetical protein [Rickettsiales bacterium]